MAYYNTTLFAALFAILWTGATAQTSCTRTLLGLSPCLNYVTGNSSTPSSTCCSQLSNVVTSQPQCLCLLLNNTAASSYGYNVNQTLALALPSVCNVQTPPLSKCNAANAPSASPPQTTPADHSSDEPVNNIPSGSKSVPSVNGAHNIGGSNIKAPLVFLLFVSTYALSEAGF